MISRPHPRTIRWPRTLRSAGFALAASFWAASAWAPGLWIVSAMAPAAAQEAESRHVASGSVSRPASAAEGVALIGTAWQFMDASGASFTARFMADGAFEGPSDMRLWRWEVTPAGLRIVFDNGMGTRIIREGRVVDTDWLNGEARAGDGRRWAWVAHRLNDQAQAANGR